MKNNHIKKYWHLLWILIFSILINSCSLFKEKYEFTEKAIMINANQGGIIENNEANLKLEILPGALPEDTIIEIGLAVLEDTPEEIQNLVAEFEETGTKAIIFRMEPDGLEFNEPVKISFEISADEVSEEGVSDFSLFYQGQGGELEYFEDIEINYDAETSNYIVSGSIDHFSWVVRTKSFLRVKLEQIEPKTRSVGEKFNVNYEIANISRTSLFKYENLSAEFFATGSVIISNYGFLNGDPLGLEVGNSLSYGQSALGNIDLECQEPGLGSYYIKVNADEIHLGQTVPVTNHKRVTASGVVICAAPTPTATATITPTNTTVPSPTPTPTITPSPTLAQTETPTPSATPEEITGTVNVGTAACLYGPSSVFLFLYGLTEGESVVVWGQNNGWLLVKPEFYASPCWIWSGLLTLEGSLTGLAYNAYDRILPRDYENLSPVTGFIMSRSGGNVEINWDAVTYISPPNLYGYLIVANTCQGNYMAQLYYLFTSNGGSIQDETSCGQTSTITIYVVDKLGYGPELNQNLP
ncbi:MAG: hypothetical protein HON98_02795 [Chloroflexi bacterium]|jgi:hypothetical protein|nr:hypothetical protein [Chloroflexota bacterium]MBT3668771.1 hypothetical protein [Chloroflexota bacterium]MBT4003234.1 hypothetical protein [Chloroflexota bacterium]MBT4305472.1 hypothetical protein [Chloroflexota bacterium]MBT4533083.1 hypothetical protein [Chloroflexota bacterium]